MVPSPPGASPAQNGASGQQSPFWNVVLPILGFIGTGIGILGFVIFFGGFIVWARFDAAGLPADQAVAQVPRNDLVVTGAGFLVPALLAALAAVTVALVLWDALVGNRRRGRLATSAARHKEAVAQVERLQGRASRIEHEVASRREKMERLDAAIKAEAPGSAERERARAEYDEEDAQCRDQLAELEGLQEEDIPNARSNESDAKRALDEAPKPDRSERLLQLAIGGIPMLVAEALIIMAAWNALGWEQAALLFGVAVATLAVAVVVATLTQHFAWYALCVFTGVALLIAFTTYERTRSTTKVSPVAAVDGAAPVTGFFVAETPEAVYVAQPHPQTPGVSLEGDGMTLVRISKKALSGLTIGSLMKKHDAYRRSLELALVLCRREKAIATTTDAQQKKAKKAKPGRRQTKAKPELRCTRKDIRALSERLEKA
jgi:hypothetical protein